MTAPRRVRPFPYDRLARVARGQAEVGRVLRSHLPLVGGAGLREVASRLGGPLQVVPADAYAFPARDLFGRLPGPPPPVLLRIAAPGDRGALLALDAGLALRLARRALDVAGFDPRSSAPPSLLPLGLDEQRALASLIDPLLAELGARVDGFPLDDAELLPLFPDPWVLALDAEIRSPVGDGWARLLAPDRLRLQAPRARRTPMLLARRARLAGARVSLAMQLGRTSVLPSELAGLEAGDVILFEEFGPRPPFGGPLLLRLGRGAFRAHLDGEGLTIVKGFELGATSMEPPKGSAAADERETSRDDETTDAVLRELPVEVVCELGRVTVSGRELLELMPGAVIPVGRPLAGPVDLTVGGRVVARGELVDVEGEIGVRVVQVHH